MKFAIIAAGEGSRLAHEGLAVPKPLVSVGGEALVERLVRIFGNNGADETVVIVNTIHPATGAYVRAMRERMEPGRLRVVFKTTPGSMYSFREIAPFLADGPFCLTTVDTIFREDEFARYIEAFRASDADGLMAVTDYVDDEKPLYVATDGELNICGFHDACEGDRYRYVSGGIYCLKPGVLPVLDACMAAGNVRMRSFQRALVTAGFRLKAYPFAKILDVDHVADVEKAEAFLRTAPAAR